MLTLQPGFHLLEKPGELPDVSRASEIFLDVETNGLHPYRGDRICGIAVTVDDDPNCYYVPVRHSGLLHPNLPLEPVVRWLRVALNRRWINHNIKFDAHFCSVDGAEFGGELVDTLTLAKLLDSDRFEYGLKPLCRDWLSMPMEEALEVQQYLKGRKDATFADVPADILGRYACMDVRANRELYRHIQGNLPEQVHGVRDTEIRLTSVLFDMEKAGLHVDVNTLRTERRKTLISLVSQATELQELTGVEVNPKSPRDVFDLFVNQMGLPVLVTKEDTGNATFDKKALELYSAHPLVLASETHIRVVELVREYRKDAQYLGLYLDPYLEGAPDGLLHPTYNQMVRTGRMSGSDPNPQQLDARAKSLVIPEPGRAFLVYDYSQIEYRLIAHYIEDEDIIRAYNEDPSVDFHSYVAKLCHISRKGGKILNFGMSFGMGKAKLTSSLASAPEIIEEISREINAEIEAGLLAPDRRNQEFSRRTTSRANEIYAIYHEKMPTLKSTSRYAASLASRRGFVFNAYGRRRHLPTQFCHKAFNSVIQSCAADIMKERTVGVAPRFNKKVRDLGIRILASVHDETLFDGPAEVMRDPAVQLYLRTELENTTVKFSVPILADGGFSGNNWAEAKDGELSLPERVWSKP